MYQLSQRHLIDIVKSNDAILRNGKFLTIRDKSTSKSRCNGISKNYSVSPSQEFSYESNTGGSTIPCGSWLYFLTKLNHWDYFYGLKLYELQYSVMYRQIVFYYERRSAVQWSRLIMYIVDRHSPTAQNQGWLTNLGTYSPQGFRAAMNIRGQRYNNSPFATVVYNNL